MTVCLNLFPCLFLFVHSFVVCALILLVLTPLCITCADLEKELVATREASTRAGGVSKELGAVMSRATQELWVALDPEALPAAHLAAVMAVGR